VFAGEVYADTVCVKKSDGTNVCLNGDQVESVLNATNVPLLQNSILSGTSTDDFSSSTSDFSTTTLETTTLPENQSGDQSSSSTQEVPSDITANQEEPVVVTDEDVSEVTQGETAPVDTETQ
jgi:hypothetical protein